MSGTIEVVYTFTGADSRNIEIPLNGTVACNVDWGDSSNENFTTGGYKSHTYSSVGTYTVIITGTVTWYGYTSSDPL